MKRLLASCALALMVGTSTGGALVAFQAGQALGAVHPDGAPRATGYVGHWMFNANDGAPQLTVPVSRSGAFNFSYRPSYCGSGSFRIVGAFTSTPFRNVPFQAEFDGMKGYLVTFTATGSCQGRQNSTGNTFTWKGARGIATGYVDNGKWPDSRGVMGIMTQVATTIGGSGPLSIDWGMAPVY